MLGLIFMDLMNGDGGVNNRWLNGLLLNYRLNGLDMCQQMNRQQLAGRY